MSAPETTTTTPVVRFDEHGLHILDHIAHTLDEIHTVLERLSRAIEAQVTAAD